jgi:hypothetical protein
MVDVTTTIVIDCSIDTVSKYATDPATAPEWYENIKSYEWQTPPPIRVGSLLAFRAHFLGKSLAYSYEVKEYLPGEKLVMSTSQGPFPMETTYRWESLGPKKTRMYLRNRGTPTGFSKLFAPFMSMAMRRANTKDLQRLKRIIEEHCI